jgi:hypothetical protein
MTLDQAIKTLEAYNAWRRGRLMPMQNPTDIGIAISLVIKAAKEHSTLSMVMNQVADKPRKTKEQRLARSCIAFLESIA